MGTTAEWIIISGEPSLVFSKGTVLRSVGDSLEIFEPGYTRSTVSFIRVKKDTLYIGQDTFLYVKTDQLWSFQRPGAKAPIRAIPMRVTDNILVDEMLIGRTLLEQAEGPHQEVYLGATVIEEFINQNYFKVRCFGEGATKNDIRLQHNQDGWAVCRRFGQPILQFWQGGFGLITLVDSVKNQHLYGRQFSTTTPDDVWKSERLIVPERAFSTAESDRFFQLINEGELRYQLTKPWSPADADSLQVYVDLIMSREDSLQDYTIIVENEAMANRAYFLPEDLGQLGLNFEPNYRFSLFAGERIIRHGLYKISADKRWLELNGGCEPTAYWHIDQFTPDHLRISALVEITVFANYKKTELKSRLATFDFYLDD
ncbi:hypothetical protein [Neolewinella persica]|uniref:hypothetical protein n=1 Tax=Neolewinella persica TaxID=70998 RepID=UPI0003712637|nr:hypothetical protein [Neolewinella persica]